MDHPLQAWRDTLGDLGVVGLVREAPATPVPPAAPERRAQVQAPPIAPPAPPRQGPPAYVPPTDPAACPSAEVVSACGSLEELQQSVAGCLACPLGGGRIKLVFGEGDPQARLLFVGEGPGRDEDLQGRPFVGKAGELLDKMISALGLRREQTYITNVVMCRPPDNRVPAPEEARACLGYLRRKIELLQPAVIVTLGATPLRELLGVSEGITRVRGQWRRLKVGDREIPVMPTFHPAYVLRQYTQDVRRAVWEDLQAAKAWMDRPDGPAAGR
jgi:DNA polymerase